MPYVIVKAEEKMEKKKNNNKKGIRNKQKNLS